MSAKKNIDVAETLSRVIAALADLTPEEQQNLLDTVATWYKLQAPKTGNRPTKLVSGSASVLSTPGGGFSQDREISPKEFLFQKQPQTDVERVACLGFYLTHYRNMPHFKTIDISKLNTEAAQRKMSNAAVAVDNSTKQNYLAPATKGNKQLSAQGELFVQALPDREAAKAEMAKVKQRKKSHKPAKKVSR